MSLSEKISAKCGARKSKRDGVPRCLPFFFSSARPRDIDQTFLLREVAQPTYAIEHRQIVSVNSHAESVIAVCHTRTE